MLKITAILLSQILLFQSSHLCIHDFSKIQTLIEHAQFHKEKYGDSFLEFVVEHYADVENKKYEQHDEHKDLPFKQEINQAHQLSFFISYSNEYQNKKVVNNTNSIKHFFYQEPTSESVLYTILQPPKFS